MTEETAMDDPDRCPHTVTDEDGYPWQCLLDRGEHVHVLPVDMAEPWHPPGTPPAYDPPPPKSLFEQEPEKDRTLWALVTIELGAIAFVVTVVLIALEVASR